MRTIITITAAWLLSSGAAGITGGIFAAVTGNIEAGKGLAWAMAALGFVGYFALRGAIVERITD